ncbi:MAG: F0F1 ATP synthase subunit B family protein [Pseudomonadota bacterium]
MPQLDPADFAPQLVWLAITFLALYLVMARVALPRIADVLAVRAERIRDDLDKAAALKAEADEALALYQKALAEARAQAGAVLRDTAQLLAALSAQRQAEVSATLAAQTKSAEAAIAAATARAMADLTSAAAETAAAATARLIGVEVDAAAARRAIAAVIEERG